MEDIIDLLNKSTETISGMHTPEGEEMWSMQNSVEDQDLVKEALGLLDIPGSLNGGEVLDWEGIPENPGLSRELGDGEEINYFGAPEESNQNSLPPVNSSNLESLEEKEEAKSITNLAKNIDLFTSYGAYMDDELTKLEKRLRNRGKNAQAEGVKNLKKSAGGGGALIGFGAALLASMLPGVSIIPQPILALVGSLSGNYAEEYWKMLNENVKLKTTIQQQGTSLKDLEEKLKAYGVTDQELQGLANHTILPPSLTAEMIKRRQGKGLPQAWLEPIKKLAQQYVQATDRLTETFKQSMPDIPQSAIADQPTLEQATQTEETQAVSETQTPVVQERKPIAAPARKGSIVRPDDPFTYDPHPEGYVVVSAPPGSEKSIGAILRPGTEGYNLVRAADPNANGTAPVTEKTPEQKASKDLFLQAQEATRNGEHAKAADLYEQAYTQAPRPETLLNAAKAHAAAGNIERAQQLFDLHRTQYPESYEKNKGIIPADYKVPQEKPIASTSPVPDQYKPTVENIQNTIGKLAQGFPVSYSTQDGVARTMESRRMRRLTEKYLSGAAENLSQGYTEKKVRGISLAEQISLVSSAIATEYGQEIEQRVEQLINAGNTGDDLKNKFYGLIWEYLRKAWARWTDANLKNKPTPGSQERRERRIDRQDNRAVERIRREKEERREAARKSTRRMIMEEIYKTAKSK